MRIRVIIFLLLFLNNIGFAQDIDAVIALLNSNKRAETKVQLESMIKSKKNEEQAEILYTLLSLSNEHYGEALQHFDRFFTLSTQPYPYVYALWNTGVFNVYNPEMDVLRDKFMTRIIADPKAPLTIKAMATDNLAQAAEYHQDFVGAKDSYKSFADIRNWSCVGGFENTSASGFNKDFMVLEHPEASYQFKNSTGATVSWFNVPDARNDRWFDFIYHFDITNAIIYAQSFVQSDKDQDVKMLLGVSGSVKVWVNDFLVFTEEEERNTDMDVYAASVKLQKGTNRILVQIGSSEINSANFMMRFADMNDRLITNLTGSQLVTPYKKAAPYTINRYPFFAEDYFDQKQQQGTLNFIDQLMLAYVYRHNDKRYESTHIAQALKQKFPLSTLVSELLTNNYSRDNNNTDLTRETESIKKNDPESLYGLQLFYSDVFGKEEYDKAQLYLQKRIDLYGANASTYYKTIELLIKKNDLDGVLKTLDKAYQLYPDNADFVNWRYNVLVNVNKNKVGADSLLEAYLANHYNETLYETLISDKMQLGQKDEAIRILESLINKKPFRIRLYINMAEKYYEMQAFAKARLWQEKAINMAPYVGGFYNTLGLIENAAGNKDAAIAAFRKSISYEPSNYTSRRKLVELEGKKDPFVYFKERNVDELYKKSADIKEYPSDNSIYLLKEIQQVIYAENGASEERHQYLIKILNQSGIDSWKELSLSYNSYTQRLIFQHGDILKKDGSRVQADRNGDQLVFSSLEVGDAIYISYKLENAVTGKLAEHFWQDFGINNWYPVSLSSFSVIVPDSKKFSYKAVNSDLKPAITGVEPGYKMYQWEKANNPAIESESNMPAFYDVAERIVISSIPDWNYITNWYHDLSTIKTKADYAIKEKVKELLKGKEKADELTKAKIFYEYIEENFNYSDVPFLHSALTPQRASTTLNSRLGDCKDLSVLFMSMCKEAGLKVNLVLVDTRDEGDHKLVLPTIGFNHCIAQLHVNGKMYLVELTDNHLPFGSMSNNIINASALYIVKDVDHKSELVKLNTPNRTGNTIDRVTTIQFKDAVATIKRSSKIAGAESSYTRGTYRDMSKIDREKQFTERLTNEFGKNVKMTDLFITNLDNLKDTIEMIYQFSLEKLTSEVAGMQIIKFPWVDTYSSASVVAAEKRDFPLNLWSFSATPYDREIITLILPAGKKLIESPKNVTYSCGSISYALSFVVKTDRVIATREVKYLKEQVSATEYAQFREVVNNMLEADKIQIAFK